MKVAAGLTNRIAEFREERGWSYAKLAEKCVPRTTASQVRKVEQGETELSLTWLRRLASAFGIRPGELLAGNDAELDEDERKCVHNLRSLPGTTGRQALNAFGSIAQLMHNVGVANAVAEHFPGEGDVAERMSHLWASWTPSQRRRALAMLETMTGFADATTPTTR